MADFKDAIKSGLAEYMDGLRKAVDGLTPAEMRWQPTLESNSISWIVWHMGRVEDRWVNRVLRGGVERWISDGWHAKFGMSEEAHGYGDTATQVRAMPDVAMSEVLEYYEAVRKSTLAHLEQMTPAERGRAEAVLHRHEMDAAQNAQLNPGARELMAELGRQGRAIGLVTRNQRASVDRVCRLHGLLDWRPP